MLGIDDVSDNGVSAAAAVDGDNVEIKAGVVTVAVVVAVTVAVVSVDFVVTSGDDLTLTTVLVDDTALGSKHAVSNGKVVAAVVVEAKAFLHNKVHWVVDLGRRVI